MVDDDAFPPAAAAPDCVEFDDGAEDGVLLVVLD